MSNKTVIKKTVKNGNDWHVYMCNIDTTKPKVKTRGRLH